MKLCTCLGYVAGNENALYYENQGVTALITKKTGGPGLHGHAMTGCQLKYMYTVCIPNVENLCLDNNNIHFQLKNVFMYISFN